MRNVDSFYNSKKATKFDKFVDLIYYLVKIFLVFGLLITFLNVFVDYIYDYDIPWVSITTLWVGVAIFLLSGICSTQSRDHAKVLLIYNSLNGSKKLIVDHFSLAILLSYAVLMILGGFVPAGDSLLGWDLYGSTILLPIPATMKPLILISIVLIVIGTLNNLIIDWYESGLINQRIFSKVYWYSKIFEIKKTKLRNLQLNLFLILTCLLVTVIFSIFLLYNYFCQNCFSEFGGLTILLTLFLGVIFLILLGIPIGFAAGFLGAIVILLNDYSELYLVMTEVYELSIKKDIIVIPFFVLLVKLIELSKIPHDLYNSLKTIVFRASKSTPFIVLVMTIIMAAMFGVVEGLVVIFGSIVLPHFLSAGFNKKQAVGFIGAGGTLAMIIPISVLLIVYGTQLLDSQEVIIEAEIVDFLNASYVPGVIISLLFVSYFAISSKLRLDKIFKPQVFVKQNYDKYFLDWLIFISPLMFGVLNVLVANFADPERVDQLIVFIVSSTILAFGIVSKLKRGQYFQISRGLLPPYVIIILVFGSIYGNLATITEATALGVIVVLLLFILRGEFKLKTFSEGVRYTIQLIGKNLWLTFGIGVFVVAIKLTNTDDLITTFVEKAEYSSYTKLLLILLIIYVLGLFLDWLCLLLIIVPLFEQTISNLGYDYLWFGVLFVITMQIAFLTPRFGSVGVKLQDLEIEIDYKIIKQSVVPYIFILLFVLILIIIFPEISLFLVNILR